MANTKTKKDTNPQTDDTVVDTNTPASPKPKAAPKAKKAKTSPTTQKTTEVEKNENENENDVKTKLSAVPMPLVKKVKEQLDGVQFKNLNELKTILETFVNVIVDTTKDGTSVTLPNYMTFKRVYRNERRHKNPKTKEEIIKPEHYVLSMYVKAQLKKQFEDIPVTDRPAKKNVENAAE